MTPLSILLADHQEFHSDLQMDSFITLRSGGTLYGCYKQALRELDARATALLQRYEARRLLEIDVEELASSEPVDPWQSERDAVRLVTRRAMLVKCDRVIEDTEREFWRFYCQAIAIRGALAEQGVCFPLDASTRDELDREMWQHRLKCMAAVELMKDGRLSTTTIEFLQALPAEMRRQLASIIFDPNRHQELIEWYMKFDANVPAPSKLDFSDIRRLIECCE
jgi:hypothetical protein